MKHPFDPMAAEAARLKALQLLQTALTKKAFNPVLIRLEGLTSIADFFLILSGGSGRQVKAIAEAILEEGRKSRLERLSAEGVHQGNWALLDYGDVIIHIFQPSVRDFYDLEGLWAEAPREVFPEDLLREIEMAKPEEDEWTEF